MSILNDLLIGMGLRTKYSARVNKGVKMLNTKHPGWRKHVVTKLEPLDMVKTYSCVLGQLGSGIGVGAEDLRDMLGFRSWHASAVAGFGSMYNLVNVLIYEDYEGLSREWNKQLGLK